MKLGIIGSSGGAALTVATKCVQDAGLPLELFVLTDRECGLETWAHSNRHVSKRIDYRDIDTFSQEAKSFFEEHDCSKVLLFYTRKVGYPLISDLGVWNIHPALLPSFRGLHGVKDAISGGVTIFGGTLHEVDDQLDTGKIIAQIASARSPDLSIKTINRLSYLHKVLLFLIWYEMLAGKANATAQTCIWQGQFMLSSPGLTNPDLIAAYQGLLNLTPLPDDR
ncbi:hypothetical protein HRR99_20625 [Agrobacterium vaccinii]|uniref:formyltransferase family protein n=1 Tax=Agrobacterium vaccinii TaxID=2735528 RepID=UPI001E4BA6EA|nr:formyltransferase family protein [Agrobacterium vaccinii]UHS63922.1 hypothetical protein HRR99_20625 [Agrobacterium vaccinii]